MCVCVYTLFVPNFMREPHRKVTITLEDHEGDKDVPFPTGDGVPSMQAVGGMRNDVALFCDEYIQVHIDTQ